jgi:hypothetical protein
MRNISAPKMVKNVARCCSNPWAFARPNPLLETGDE